MGIYCGCGFVRGYKDTGNKFRNIKCGVCDENKVSILAYFGTTSGKAS